MKIEELMELYTKDVMVDVYYKGREIAISTAPNLAKGYKGSTVERFEVVHKSWGEGRLTVHLKEAIEDGLFYEEWRKHGK